ncbi:hypothetical protein K469DRAFT_689213 [Zopfia rhizophila CBS 207.26]|uniref:Uncharacterized protein n=1 Tax=Zopfia rhizophila CBS 207.26 TaxID=1314779 RepID=A0A6A6EVP7_9PEZI|nr:hypothetical protein K469DRAFT_689213 [Zopfia rhizophila CBS 207.26]
MPVEEKRRSVKLTSRINSVLRVDTDLLCQMPHGPNEWCRICPSPVKVNSQGNPNLANGTIIGKPMKFEYPSDPGSPENQNQGVHSTQACALFPKNIGETLVSSSGWDEDEEDEDWEDPTFPATLWTDAIAKWMWETINRLDGLKPAPNKALEIGFSACDIAAGSSIFFVPGHISLSNQIMIAGNITSEFLDRLRVMVREQDERMNGRF